MSLSPMEHKLRRAISFFFATNGRVDRLVESRPEPYPAPTVFQSSRRDGAFALRLRHGFSPTLADRGPNSSASSAKVSG